MKFCLVHLFPLFISFFFLFPFFFFFETGFYQVGRASLEPTTLFLLCAGTPGMAYHIQLHSCSSILAPTELSHTALPITPTFGRLRQEDC